MDRVPSGDRLLAVSLVALVAFLLGLAARPADLVDGLRHFPAPTAAWATIITGLAWPAVAVAALFGFGREVASVARTVAARVAGDRKVTLPGGISFERETVEAAAGTADRLLQLTETAAGKARLEAYVAGLDLSPRPTAVEFATRPRYSAYWPQAKAVLGE